MAIEIIVVSIIININSFLRTILHTHSSVHEPISKNTYKMSKLCLLVSFWLTWMFYLGFGYSLGVVKWLSIYTFKELDF